MEKSPVKWQVMPAGVIEAKAALRRQLAGVLCSDWSPMVEAFLALPEVKQARTVMIFYGAKADEPDTRFLTEELLRRGKTVALPRCMPGREMQARAITAQSILITGKFGIPEPGEDLPLVDKSEIDLILVPNLCCDEDGFRLGRGGGYYDRFLKDFTGVSVALCPQERLVGALPTESTDVPVDIILTQTQIRRRAGAPRRIREESAAIK